MTERIQSCRECHLFQCEPTEREAETHRIHTEVASQAAEQVYKVSGP